MIRFEEPLFFLLLLLPLLVKLGRRTAPGSGIRFSSLAIVAGQPWWKTSLFGFPGTLMIAVFVLAVAALANPVTQDTVVTEHEHGYRIPIAFDVSFSMRQGDRLEHAKEGAVEFVRTRSEQDIISLVPWATRIHMEHGAFFTTDSGFLVERIRQLRTLGLTAMGDAALFSAVMILADIHHMHELDRLGVPEPHYLTYRSLVNSAEEAELSAFLDQLAFYYQGLIEGSFILIVTDAVGEMNAGIDWDRAVEFIVALDIPMYLVSVEERPGLPIRDVLSEAGIEFFYVEDAQDVSMVYRQISERNPTLVRVLREEVSQSLRHEVALAAGLLAALAGAGYSTFITFTRREV